MENVLCFLTSLDDSEIDTMLTFLKEYKKSREIEEKTEKICKTLRKIGESEIEIESYKISLLRRMKLINIDQEIHLKTQLYGH